MMDIKRFAVALSCACTVAASPNATATTTVAIVKLNDDGHNYLYTSSKISPGDTVHFQFPRNDKPSCCKHADGKTATLATADPDAVDFDTDRKLYRYELVSKSAPSELPFIGIAVIGKNLTVTPAKTWRLEVQSGSESQDVTLCTSNEGVHVVSQSGGKKVSHLYLYLGYDIENPTCDNQPAK